MIEEKEGMGGGLASGGGSFWSFAMVEERMVEAVRLWRRMPDRERGWFKSRAYWPEIFRHHHFGDYADTEAVPRPRPLTRAQIAEMQEATEWLRFVPARDRRLVVLAIGRLADGEKRVPWLALRKAMGVEFGAHGLRKRYSRAISSVAQALNGAEIRDWRLSSPRTQA